MKIEEYKTTCCKAKWYRKNKIDYRCLTCDKDVTMDIIYLLQATKDSKPKSNNNKL